MYLNESSSSVNSAPDCFELIHIKHYDIYCYEGLISQNHTTIILIQSQGNKDFKIKVCYKTLAIYIQATLMANKRYVID